MLLAFRTRENDAHGNERRDLLGLLGLNSEIQEYRIVPGTLAQTNEEVAILTRSVYQVMNELAACISVPEPDLAESRVYKVEPKQVAPHGREQPCLWICSSEKEPQAPFVAVQYRDHWFWIADNDLHTKGMFNFLLLLFSFAETGENDLSTPLITIPTN